MSAISEREAARVARRARTAKRLRMVRAVWRVCDGLLDENRAIRVDVEREARDACAKEVEARRSWVERFHAGRSDIRSAEVLDWLMELADEIRGNSP